MSTILTRIFDPNESEDNGDFIKAVENLKKALKKTQTSSALFAAIVDSKEMKGVIELAKVEKEIEELLLDFEKA